MTKRKVLGRVAIGLLIFLLICTFLSRSIYLAMLPEVETGSVSTGNLSNDLYYIGSFDYTEKQTVTAGSNWLLTEVNCKIGDTVEKGDLLATVDMTDADLERRGLALNLESLQAALKQTTGTLARAQMQLSIDQAQRQLDLFDESYPKNGKIYAKAAGRVLTASYVTGDTAYAGSVVFEIQTEDSRPVVSWTASYEEGRSFDVGDSVQIAFAVEQDGKQNQQSLKNFIAQKELDAESGNWVFSLTLTNFTNTIPLQARPTITLTNELASGMQIVPVSALTSTGSDSAVVYVVNSRQGIFSEEYYITQVEVKVRAQNNIDAAVEGNLAENAKVVTYSSKSLSNGAVVTLA
jgi:hypothetical protein